MERRKKLVTSFGRFYALLFLIKPGASSASVSLQ